MLSMFGNTYICECTSSNTYMKHIKSKQRNRLTVDETLSHLPRDSSFEIKVNFATLSLAATHSQNSH